MSLTKIWSIGIVLGVVTACGVSENLWAQTWHAARPADNSVVPTNWEQRVLKRPQQPLKWQSVQHSENSSGQAVESYQAADQYQRAASPYQTARRQSYNRNVFGTVSMQRESVAASQEQAPLTGDMEVIPPGTTEFEPVATEGAFAGANCGAPAVGCDGCDLCGAPACDDCCDFGWEVFDGTCGRWLRGLSVFAGGDAFKGPADHGTNGNFGLNEGLNLARPLGDPWGCGFQLGANFVQSDFSGAPTVTVAHQYNLRAAYRKQYFATAGLFRRADECGGFQWGVAYDYLHDIFYEGADLQQIRSETGFVIDDVYEIGYYGAYGVGTDRVYDARMDPTDMFVLYARRNFENGGNGRISGGATGNGDGLLGADLWVPLGKGFALENRINYMIPKEGRGDGAQTRESWGLTIQLVWYPGQNALCQQRNPYRPMFNVADNSLFMVDRLSTAPTALVW